MNDLDAVLRQLGRDGWMISRTRKGHLKIKDQHGRLAAVTGTTPSDHRAIANLRARIRRHRAIDMTHSPGTQ